MEELLLINPSASPKKRKGVKKMAKRRTAAQKRATAKLVALNRARRKGGKNPRRKGVVRSASYASNPSPARRKSYRRNPITSRIRRRSYRRNPSPRAIVPMFKDSAIGAVGAAGITSLFSYLPLPAMFSSGNMKHVAKGAFAVAVGMLGAKILPRGVAGKMAQGSLTVTMYEAIKDNVGGMVPGLSGIGYFPGGMVATRLPRGNAQPAPMLSEYVNSGMGEYVRSGMGEVGNEIY